MKEIFKTSICILLLFLISSCNSFNSASSNSKMSVQNSSNTSQDYQSALSQMNELKSEVDLLKERLLKIENLSFLIDAKEYNDGLRIYLGKTSSNENFNSIDIKLPVKNYNKL